MARIRAAVLIGVCLCPALQLAQSPPPSTGAATAVVAELDGIIHPISAEYIDEAIDQADTSGADVVVFVLRTPGGLLDSTRDIVSRMITSRAPVVVFVGPSGARAASAGLHPDHGRRRRRRWRRARTSARRIRCRARRAAMDDDDGEEGGVRRGRVRAIARRGARRNVTLAAEAVIEEPRVHRSRSARRLAAADRSRRARTSTICCGSSTAGRSRASTAGPSTVRTAECRRSDGRDDATPAVSRAPSRIRRSPTCC